MHICVTGGTGFIGSHCVLELLQANHIVTVISSLTTSITDSKGQPISLKRTELMTGKSINFKKVDLLNLKELEDIFEAENFDTVMHFASLKGVGESCKEPLKFYYSNIIGSLNLISVCKKYNVKNFIFSSSPSVYGNPKDFPIKENSASGMGITNPYGKSNFMIEKILKDLSDFDKEWNVISLRYFNPTGAHPSGLIGEYSKNVPNQLMPFITHVLTGKLPYLTIFGNDFNTPDGTCIRDYIHVVDAAQGHLSALERISKGKCNGFEVYNLGMGKGYSVMEMVKAMEHASGRKVKNLIIVSFEEKLLIVLMKYGKFSSNKLNIYIPIKIMPRRLGDVPCLYCDPTLAEKDLKWKTKFTLEDMCRDVCNWQKMNPNGYFEKDKDQHLKQG